MGEHQTGVRGSAHDEGRTPLELDALEAPTFGFDEDHGHGARLVRSVAAFNPAARRTRNDGAQINSGGPVSLAFHDDIAILILDDGKANALSTATLAVMETALDAVEASGAGALLLAGRTGFFSGGLDLKELPLLTPAARTETFARFARLALRLWTFDRPVVAALTGHTLGGGAILALGADVRLGVETDAARIGLIEVAVGLPVPRFAVEMARAALPAPTLVQAVTHGRAWSLREAHGAGWVDALAPADELLARATQRAASLAKLARGPYVETKRALQEPWRQRAEAGFTADVESFIAAFDARTASAR